MEHQATIEVEHDVLVEMNRILALTEGLEDTKDGDTIQTFCANFDDGVQADIKVCNGSRTIEGIGEGDSPWMDCVLFDKDNNEITCFVGQTYQLDGEYIFHDDGETYVVIIKEKKNG